VDLDVKQKATQEEKKKSLKKIFFVDNFQRELN